MTDPVTVIHGDSRAELVRLAEQGVLFDAVVTDPPYGIGFMNRTWDHPENIAFDPEFWTAIRRVMKPGAHLLSFSATRTYHRMATAVEDAGFEIRDKIDWLYGSGFPKSLDVGKAIDKARLDQLPVVYRVTEYIREARDASGKTNRDIDRLFGFNGMGSHWTSAGPQAASPTYAQWMDIKTLLGAGDAIDIDVAALDATRGTFDPAFEQREFHETPTGGLHNGSGNTVGSFTGRQAKRGAVKDEAKPWEGWGTALKPACEPIVLARNPFPHSVAYNVVTHGVGAINIDGCRVGDEVMPAAVGERKSNGIYSDQKWDIPERIGRFPANVIHDGSDDVRRLFGDAHRFFYSAKADKEDRAGSAHISVKPVDLMQYLVRMVTPPGGLVLDPFGGSGSTGAAIIREGARGVLIEREDDYAADIRRRIAAEVVRPVQGRML